MAAAQNGRVARWQLLAQGISRSAIGRRVRSGLLIPIHPGVYAVGHRDRGNLGAWSAAVLLGGPGAVLSHRSASGLRVLLPSPSSFSEVTTPGCRARNRRVHWHTSVVPPDEREVIDDIPVTSLHRTLIDIAPIVGVEQLEYVLHRITERGLTDRVPLDEMLDRHRGRRGIARLREALGNRYETGWTLEKFEYLFARFLQRYRLPRPETNVLIELPGDAVSVDCLWRRERLIVELDSRRHHLDPVAFERDRERDAALISAGWRVIRVTWRRFHDDPGGLAAQLRALLLFDLAKRPDRLHGLG